MPGGTASVGPRASARRPSGPRQRTRGPKPGGQGPSQGSTAMNAQGAQPGGPGGPARGPGCPAVRPKAHSQKPSEHSHGHMGAQPAAHMAQPWGPGCAAREPSAPRKGARRPRGAMGPRCMLEEHTKALMLYMFGDRCWVSWWQKVQETLDIYGFCARRRSGQMVLEANHFQDPDVSREVRSLESSASRLWAPPLPGMTDQDLNTSRRRHPGLVQRSAVSPLPAL